VTSIGRRPGGSAPAQPHDGIEPAARSLFQLDLAAVRHDQPPGGEPEAALAVNRPGEVGRLRTELAAAAANRVRTLAA
jgi:hypothetical protein